MHNRRAIGLLFLVLGFLFALFGIIGLAFACVFWVLGTVLYAKSFLDQ